MKTKTTKFFTKTEADKDGIFLFFLSALIFFLETNFFHMIVFIKDYLSAHLLLVYVLFGMSAGAFISNFYRNTNKKHVLILTLFLVLSVYLAAGNIIWYSNFFLLSPLLWIPFAISGLIIAQLFRTHHSGKMYFYDLLGALFGIILSVLLIPALRVENCILLSGIFLSFWGFFYATPFTKSPQKAHKRNHIYISILFTIFLIITIGGFLYNLKTDNFNIAKITKRTNQTDPNKIFCWSNSNIEYSQDTLIQRIDVMGMRMKKNIAYNGYSNDSIFPINTNRYRFDQRIIHNLVTEPDILIVGAAAEGIIKPAKNETIASKIDAIEINPAIIKIMQGKYFNFSKRAYEGINLIKNDVNTYLHQTDKKYDIITLINTHLVKTLNYYGGPEYLHTQESIHQYFDHLKQGGHIMIEERENTENAVNSLYRIIATFYSVMRERGIKNPEKNIFIYSHYFGKPQLTSDKKLISKKYYVNVLFKNTPISNKDKRIIANWKLRNRRVKIEYVPWKETKSNEIAQLFLDLQKDVVPISLKPITDNRPFPFDINGQIQHISRSFHKHSIVFFILFAFLIGFIFFKPQVREKKVFSSLAILYLVILGMSFLLIEIFMMQFYHKLMGGPAYALIFIMGTLLFSSGFGALFFKHLKPQYIIIAICLIPVLLLFHLFLNKNIVLTFASTPLVNSLLVSITIIPLGILMGIPFPYILESIKDKLGSQSFPLFFCCNLLAAAFGVLFSLYISILYGFSLTFLIGMASYVAIAVMVWRIEANVPRLSSRQPIQKRKLTSFFIIFTAFILVSVSSTKGSEQDNYTITNEKDFQKINAHESIYSEDQIPIHRKISKELGIKHTVLIGHFEEVFNERSKWNVHQFNLKNNNVVIDIAKKYPEEYSAITIVNPHDPAVYEKIENYMANGAIGIQVYDSAFKRRMDNGLYDPFFQYLESRQIPIYFRTSICRRFNELDSILNRYQDLRIMIPHFLVCETDPERIEYFLMKHKNVCFDISYGFKYWRHKHLKNVSKNIEDLRDIIIRFSDRVFFATDIVISNEPWKNENYIRKSYSDYISLLEKSSFTFSVSNQELNGFHLPSDILQKIYSENFTNFFIKDISPFPEEIYVSQIPEQNQKFPVTDPKHQRTCNVLLAAISHIFSKQTSISYKNGFIQNTDIKNIYIDQRLSDIFFLKNKNVEYLELNQLRGKIRSEKDAIGILQLSDITYKEKLLRVNKISLLDRNLRYNRHLLEQYELFSHIQKFSPAVEYIFDPYQYASVLISGSSLIGQGLKKEKGEIDLEKMIKGIETVVRDADISHISLETSVISDCQNNLRRFYFCTDRDEFATLPMLGIDIVGLTGNHLLDFGSEKFLNTLKLYKTFNIQYYGGGENEIAAKSPLVINIFKNDIRFTGYNDISGRKGIAKNWIPGSNDLNTQEMLTETNSISDDSVTIIDLQYGSEFAPYPEYFQRFITKSISDKKVILNGLHSHSIKPFEFLKNATAFYGLGNFLFFHPSNLFDTSHALLLKYFFHKSSLIQIEIIPIAIEKDRITLGDNRTISKLEEITYRQNNRREIFQPVFVGNEKDILLNRWAKKRLLRNFQTKIIESDNSDSKGIFIVDALKSKTISSERILFSFRDSNEANAFLKMLNDDHKRVKTFFVTHSEQIVFGGVVFTPESCKRAYFFYNKLFELYRNILESEEFYFPNLNYCGGEWWYDYKRESLVKGLYLSDKILMKIYGGTLTSQRNKEINGTQITK